MAFYSAFVDFISWVFTLESFRLCIAVVCCFAGWFCVSELARYLLSPGGETDDN